MAERVQQQQAQVSQCLAETSKTSQEPSSPSSPLQAACECATAKKPALEVLPQTLEPAVGSTCSVDGSLRNMEDATHTGGQCAAGGSHCSPSLETSTSTAEPLLAEVSGESSLCPGTSQQGGVGSLCPGTSQQESPKSLPDVASDSRGSCKPLVEVPIHCDADNAGEESGSTTLGALDGSDSGIAYQVPPIVAVEAVGTLGNSRNNFPQDGKQLPQQFDLAAEDWVEDEDEFFPLVLATGLHS